MKKSWALALRNMRRNRRRNFATGTAIALGFAGLLIVGGYAYRVANYMRVYTQYATHVGHLMIYKKDGLDKFATRPTKYSFAPEDQQKIETLVKQDITVAFFEKQLTGSGLIGNGCKSFPFVARGIEPETDRKLRSHPEVEKWAPKLRNFLRGRGLWEFDSTLSPVSLSPGVAKFLGKSKVHDEISQSGSLQAVLDCNAPDASQRFSEDANVQLLGGTWDGSISAIDGEVVSHFSTGFSEGDNSAIVLPVGQLQKLYATDNVSAYAIWFVDTASLSQKLNQFSESLRVAGVDVDVFRWDDERISPGYVGTVSFIFSMVSFIGTILASVIGLSIFNAATITVLERSQEVGMLRSVGYTRGEIRGLFLRETVLLSVVSLFIGGVIGFSVMTAVNSANIIFHPPGVVGGIQLMLVPNLQIAICAAMVVVLLAVLATWSAVRGLAAKTISTLLLGVHR